MLCLCRIEATTYDHSLSAKGKVSKQPQEYENGSTEKSTHGTQGWKKQKYCPKSAYYSDNLQENSHKVQCVNYFHLQE